MLVQRCFQNSLLANRRRDEEATIRGRERHEITPVYRPLVFQTWRAWQLHDPKRENSRAKLQNVVTDSLAGSLGDEPIRLGKARFAIMKFKDKKAIPRPDAGGEAPRKASRRDHLGVSLPVKGATAVGCFSGSLLGR